MGKFSLIIVCQNPDSLTLVLGKKDVKYLTNNCLGRIKVILRQVKNQYRLGNNTYELYLSNMIQTKYFVGLKVQLGNKGSGYEGQTII